MHTEVGEVAHIGQAHTAVLKLRCLRQYLREPYKTRQKVARKDRQFLTTVRVRRL
jgi:hypothetical protein